MTESELQTLLNKCQVELISINNRSVVIRAAFDAACFDNDTEQISTQRENYHALLDIQLDTIATMMHITRKLLELKQ